MQDALEAIRRLALRRVVVFTGAGVSADSGIPTFRGAGGLWRSFRAEDLATPEAFARDPELVLEWYEWRRGLVRAAEPNAAHRAIARLDDALVVTQNVDGLHARAGSRNVIELHGNIFRTRRAGAYERPDVVWFGEMLPFGALEAASEAARGCNVFLSVGTSSLVYPAAALPYEALENGAVLAEINPKETPLTQHADHSLRGLAGEVLPNLLREAFGPPSD